MEQIQKDRFLENLAKLDVFFERGDIAALAETHHGKHTDEIMTYLDKFLPILNGIFVELPVDYQSSIDSYISTGKTDHRLNSFFEGALKEGKDIKDLLKIFDKVKESNKPVILIDSSKIKTDEYKSKSEYGYYFLRGKSRDEDMFENVKQYYEKHPGKYFVIAGLNHIKTGRHPRSGENTLGTRLKDYFSDKHISINMV